MAQKTQNRGNRTKSSRSKKISINEIGLIEEIKIAKPKRNLIMSALKLLKTVLMVILLTLILASQAIIIAQNDLIGKEVKWISFLVEGGKKRDRKPRYPNYPTSPSDIRYHKIDSLFTNLYGIP